MLQYLAGQGVDLVIVLDAVGGELHLIDLSAVLPIRLHSQPLRLGCADARMLQGDLLGLLFADRLLGWDRICRKLFPLAFHYLTGHRIDLVLELDAIGRKLRFIGGNEKCAEQTGINKTKTLYQSFLFAGIGVGLAGVFQTLRTANVASTVGAGMGMDVMLATVLGGMSIFGGTKSNCFAGMIGAVTVTILDKGLLMMGVSSTMIQGVRGIIFLLLVFLNSERPKTLPSRQQF